MLAAPGSAPHSAASDLKTRALLTIDVEDYFQVEAFSSTVRLEDWPEYESRIERNTHLALTLLDDCNALGTFFIVGWVAERFPGLVRAIRDRGHEIGCHSYWHRPAYRLSPDEFRQDAARAKSVLEDITGEMVIGYRAPTFSITRKTLWALDILAELGFLYDASIYPIRHDHYGIPDWERGPGSVNTSAGPILEVPGCTVRWLGTNLPCGGGGYLRLLPMSFNISALRSVWTQEKRPGIIYFHPWELDPDQPRIRAGFLSRLRHYAGLNTMDARLRKLLKEFAVSPVAVAMAPLLSRVETPGEVHVKATGGD